MLEYRQVWCKSCTSARWPRDLYLSLAITGGRGTGAYDIGPRAVGDPTGLVVWNTGNALLQFMMPCMVRE